MVVPVHIERSNKFFFKLSIDEPIKFDETKTTNEISLFLNNWLEKKIIKNPDQWIWSHNRWK
jgi:KDO2-lipid IV(A) lauroyltransferase